MQVSQLLSQSAGTSFCEFAEAVAPSLAQIFGFSYGKLLAFNSKSPSFMLACTPEPVCVYASGSLAQNALSGGRISVVVDPARQPAYSAAIDGPAGEQVALAAYVPIPDDRDPSSFIAILLLAHLLPPSHTAAAEARHKHVSDECVELLKLVSIMLSAPLSRSITLQASDKRLSECDHPKALFLHFCVSTFPIFCLNDRCRYRAAAAYMSTCQVTSRVGFDSNSTLFAAAEHFMSAFACDVVKIVSVVDQDARDVVLHVTVSRGVHPCCAPTQLIA
jgi:hypothetical protein